MTVIILIIGIIDIIIVITHPAARHRSGDSCPGCGCGDYGFLWALSVASSNAKLVLVTVDAAMIVAGRPRIVGVGFLYKL